MWQHNDAFSLIKAWSDEKLSYLRSREVEIKNFEANHYLDVQSVEAARFQLLLHDRFVSDKKALTSADVATLKALGKEILSRKYETPHSTYVYEKPKEIQERESKVDDFWEELDRESQLKRPILEDHLARNEFQEKVRLWVKNHEDMYLQLLGWYKSKQAYLETKEVVSSSSTAKFQLALLRAYEKSKENKTAALLEPLKTLGRDICSAVFDSAHSRWVVVLMT